MEILTEIYELGPAHPWAGCYSCYIQLAFWSSLAAAPRSGFVEATTRDAGGNMPPMGGNVTEVDGSLHFMGWLSPMWPTRWGPRHYLLPEDAFLPFCLSVNEGEEPRRPHDPTGRFLLREGDEGREVIGLPALPAKFLPYLLSEPIVGTVTLVSAIAGAEYGKWCDLRVTLDRGRAAGVFPDCKFFLVRPEGYTSGKVMELDEQTCVIKVAADKDDLVRAGESFSTRRPPREKDRRFN